MLGLVMVLSASSIDALRQGGSGWVYFLRQALWAVLGAARSSWRTGCPTARCGRSSGPACCSSFAVNVAVAVPGVGEVNGARAWFDVGPFGFQPSEVLKLTILVYTADLLARRADRMGDLRATFRPLMLMLALASVS